jgi:hypothetical protein
MDRSQRSLRSSPEHRPGKHYDTSQKKGKKRKNRNSDGQEKSLDQSEEAEGESEPPKKKHKNRTSFADPREDTQLNAQSRKGVHCKRL